jgi:hypothetical protein
VSSVSRPVDRMLAPLIFGQRSICQLDPTARARLNSAYLATFFVGGAVAPPVALPSMI